MTEYVLECQTGDLYGTNTMGRTNPTSNFAVKIDKFGNMDIDCEHYNIGLGYNPRTIHNVAKIHDNVQIPDYLLDVIKTLITGASLEPRNTYDRAIIPAIQKIKEGLKSSVSQQKPDAATWKSLVVKNAKLETDIIAANKKHTDLLATHNKMKQDLVQEIDALKSRYAKKEDDLHKRETELRKRENRYEESSRAVRTADRKIADENRELKDLNAKWAAEWAEMERKFKDTLVYNADLREEVRMLRDRSNNRARPENQYRI